MTINTQAELIFFSCLAIVLLIPPLIWHTKNKNISSIALIFWLLIMDIETFINAIIWGGEHYYDSWNGKSYCDVFIRLEVGASIGIICAIASLSFNLYLIINGTSTFFLNSTKKVVIECSMCFISPVVLMAINYIDQARRYVITRYRGCANGMGANWTIIVIYSLWPLLWSLVALFFAAMTLLHFVKKRKDINDILLCNCSGLNYRKFSRLLIFCILIILCMFPLALYDLIDDVRSVVGYDTSFSWNEIHDKYSWNIIAFLDSKNADLVLYDKWCIIAVSYASFAIFGLGADALSMYKEILVHLGLGPVMNKFSAFKKKAFDKNNKDETNKSRYNQYYNGERTSSNDSSYDTINFRQTTLVSSYDVTLDKLINSNFPSSTTTKMNEDIEKLYDFDVEKLTTTTPLEKVYKHEQMLTLQNKTNPFYSKEDDFAIYTKSVDDIDYRSAPAVNVITQTHPISELEYRPKQFADDRLNFCDMVDTISNEEDEDVSNEEDEDVGFKYKIEITQHQRPTEKDNSHQHGNH